MNEAERRKYRLEGGFIKLLLCILIATYALGLSDIRIPRNAALIATGWFLLTAIGTIGMLTDTKRHITLHSVVLFVLCGFAIGLFSDPNVNRITGTDLFVFGLTSLLLFGIDLIDVIGLQRIQ